MDAATGAVQDDTGKRTGEATLELADGDTAVVGDYRVNGDACTCQWWAKYRGGRGKCKHVLAADMVRSKA